MNLMFIQFAYLTLGSSTLKLSKKETSGNSFKVLEPPCISGPISFLKSGIRISRVTRAASLFACFLDVPTPLPYSISPKDGSSSSKEIRGYLDKLEG